MRTSSMHDLRAIHPTSVLDSKYTITIFSARKYMLRDMLIQDLSSQGYYFTLLRIYELYLAGLVHIIT